MRARHEVRRASAAGTIRGLAAAALVLTALAAVTLGVADAARRGHKHQPATHGKVDLNRSPLSDIERLPGIGTVLAQRIIAGRPYKSLRDLEQAGLPATAVKGLEGKVVIGGLKTAAPSRAPRAARSAAAAAPPAQRAPPPPAPAARGPAAAAHAPPSPPTPVAQTYASHPSAAAAPTSPVKPGPAHAAGAATARTSSPTAKPGKKRTFLGIPIGDTSPAAPETPRALPRARTAAYSGERQLGTSRAALPPAKGMVWVNFDTKLYHYEGDSEYGLTRHGMWLWEDQAVREGYRAVRPPSMP